MGFIQNWLRERRFDREHRPYLIIRLPDPVVHDDGMIYQPGFMNFYCTKHECWFRDCPKTDR